METRSVTPIRKRMRRREVPGQARFVTFSCHRRLPLLGKPAIRDVFVEAMAAARRTHRFELFAWVVMPEHVHLLVRPRLEKVPEGRRGAGELEGRLDEALASLKTSVAKLVVGRWRELRAPVLEQLRVKGDRIRYWQKGGGFDRNVRDLAAFCRHVGYIHRNPVKRELVSAPEDWKWSSVRWWMGQREGELECDPPPGDPRAWAGWKGYV
jgi:putative transposase